ncbi:MAG: hypothetical protein ACE5EU_10875 [Paracoccaceae bacterium]
MARINIQFTLFSAFYSPLISAMSGGFLKAKGLEPNGRSRPPASRPWPRSPTARCMSPSRR